MLPGLATSPFTSLVATNAKSIENPAHPPPHPPSVGYNVSTYVSIGFYKGARSLYRAALELLYVTVCVCVYGPLD